MAVVGDAYIVVRAITNRVRPQIQSAFSGLGDIGDKAGSDVSEGFNRGLSKGGGAGSIFTKKFENDAEKARIKLRSLTQAGFFAGPAFTALAGAIGALGGGIVTLGVVAGAAAQGGLLVLGGSITALIQGALTLKLAFSGVADAISAGNKASSGGAAQAKALEAAQKRLDKAELNLFRTREDRKDQIEQIKRANADAQRSAADAVISAKRSDRSYQDSVRNTQKVIEAVTKARKDAVEALQQLRFETEGGAISEKKARIEFEKARDSLQRVQDLPPNSRARQEAELAFAEADLNLRQAIDRNADLKQAEKEKTVEVAKMQQQTIMQTQEVKDAQQAQTDAYVDATRAQIDAAQAVADAKKSAADMEGGPDKGKAFKDINRTLADAKDAVKEAKKDLLDAERGGGAADAFADAMAKLSPEAQKFVKFIIGLRGEFDKLKAAAGKELFPRLEIAIQNLVDNLFPKLAPLLEGTGKVLGDIAIGFSNTVTKAENIKRLESIWKTNDELLGKFGLAANNLYENFLILLDAAKPLIDAFGDWIVEVTGAWNATLKADEASGALNEKMLRIKDVLGGLGKAGGDFWKALKDIFSVIMEEGGAADVLVGYLKDAASNFKDFISAGKEDGTLKEFFVTTTENFTKILTIIGKVVGGLMKMGAAPGTGQFLDSLIKVVDTFTLIGDKLGGKDGPTAMLGKLLEGFAELSLKLTESGSIEAFFTVLQAGLDVANAIFGNAGVQKVMAFTGVILGVVKGAGLLLRVIGFIGKALIGNVLKVFKDPFAALRKGSGLTRAELKKQMVVDAQKKNAMNGIFTSGRQAARGITLVKDESAKARPSIKQTAELIRTKYNTAITGIKTAGDKARTAMTQVAGGATTLSAKLRASAAGSKIKAGALKGIGTAGRIAGAGMKAAGRGLGALFGGPIGIILLLLPLIIENWDAIVAFFKDLIPKLGQIFSDMWGGLTKFLGEAWTNISTWFMEVFIPGMGDFFLKVLDVITWILFPLPRLILKFWPEISKFFTETVFPWFAALPGKVLALAGKIWNFLSDAASNVWKAVSGWWTGTVVPWFTGLAGKVLGFAGKVWNFLSDGVKTAWSAVTGFFTNTVPGFLGSLPGKFANALKGLWDGIAGGLKFAWEAAKQWWNNNVANKKLVIGGFKVLGVQIPKVELGFPRLAKGGIIPATPGGTMAMIGEAGKAERVEPLDSNGLSKRDKAMIDYMSGGAGGGVTIIVNPSAGMDERELADLVSRKLAQQLRMGAA